MLSFLQKKFRYQLDRFISNVLAHNENSLQTALSYQNLNIQFEEEEIKMIMENKESIANLRIMVEEMRANI